MEEERSVTDDVPEPPGERYVGRTPDTSAGAQPGETQIAGAAQ